MSFDSLFIKRSLYLCDVGEPILYANSISGSINEVTNSDKSIWLYDRNTGDLLSSTILDRSTRNWKIQTDKNHDPESMFIICRDEGGEYNGDIYDRVSLCTTEYSLPEGISSTIYWPKEHIIYTEAYPRHLHEYYNVDVPNLKGEITKVIQGSNDDKVKFVDSSGNEIQNGVTSNNVLINDNSIVLNGTIKNSYLKKWTPNILNDDTEIFLSEYKDGIWCNHYDNTPLSSDIKAKKGCDLCVGGFEEPAILFPFYTGDITDNSGLYCGIDLTNTEAVSFSAWLLMTSCMSGYMQSGSYVGYNYTRYNIISLRDSVYSNKFFAGIMGPIFALQSRDQIVKTTYNITSITAGHTNTTVTNDMYGGNEFRWSNGWHHVVVTRTATTIKTYIDGYLIKETSFTASAIPNRIYLVLGYAYSNDTGYDYNMAYGRISGIRVFNRELIQSDIDTLKNDRPRVEQDVASVKGMECAGNLLYLGGIPYNYVDKYYLGMYKEVSDGITNVVRTSTLDAKEALNAINNNCPTLLKDSVFINKINRGGTYFGNTSWGLSTSTKLETETGYTDGVIDFDTSDLEIYMRFIYKYATGIEFNIIHIGNKQKEISVWIYPSSNRLRVSFNSTTVCSVIVNSTQYGGEWLKLKVNPVGVSVFTDDDELIVSGNISTAVPQITIGHIDIGGLRTRMTNSTQSQVPDSATGNIIVSDVKFTKYSGIIDPLVAEEVYREYKFGYERNGLAGLHLHSTNNKQIIRNFDDSGYAITQYTASSKEIDYLMIVVKGENNLKNILNNEKGFTVTSYHRQEKSNLVSPIPFQAISYQLGNAVKYLSHRASDDVVPAITIGTYQNNSLNGNRYIAMADMNMWHSCMFIHNNNLGYSDIYTDGTYVRRYDGNLRDDGDNFYYINSYSDASASKGCVDELKVYKTTFPEQLSRNLHQNYQGKVYKNDMQVAFIDQKHSFPLFKGIPISSITMEGETNGQVLSFAVTKDGTDYYIYDTAWKKILTKENDIWKYLNGNSWVSSGTDKWKAAAQAMEISSNRMSISKINSLNAVKLAEFYDGTGTVFNFAVGMKSNGTKSPYIDGMLINNCKVWLSPEINLSDFSNTNYITKAHFKCVVSEGQTNGITLYSHVSGTSGWKKVDNFSRIPDINQNMANNGTVQFMLMFDQNKQNGKEPTALSVTIE